MEDFADAGGSVYVLTSHVCMCFLFLIECMLLVDLMGRTFMMMKML
jgi:hypothetical protein